MGALYEDVENFFGDIFAWYGRIVARHPLPFILIPLLASGLLGLGLISIEYETDLENLYTPISSQASNDRAQLLQLFPDRSHSAFYSHQSIAMPAYGEVIVTIRELETRQNNDNADDYLQATINNNGGVPDNHNITAESDDAMRRRFFDEVRLLCRRLHAMEARVKKDRISVGKKVRYSDVCALRDGRCVIDGDHVRYRKTSICDANANIFHVNGSVYFAGLATSASAVQDFVFNGHNETKSDASVPVIKLRFNLNTNSSDALMRSIAWQDQFIEYLKVYESDLVNVSFVASHSLQIELRDHVGADTKYLGVSVVAMLVLATVTGSGVNCVGNHITLAYAGVVAALLAILAAFGLLSLAGLRFVNLCSVMPFLVLGIGADDMFQLLTEWRKSDIRNTTEERLANTLRSAAVSITITSLTDLLAFCIGATSPFLSVRNFCACSGLAIFLCYVNQLTFFSGCIVLHSRRVDTSRHCITCHKTTSRDNLQREGTTGRVGLCLCAGNSPRIQEDEEGLYRRITLGFNRVYPRALLHWVGKCVVVGVFVLYIILSVWGVSKLEEGFTLETLVPPEKYYRVHHELDRQLYSDEGSPIMFVVNKPDVGYHQLEVRQQLSAFLESAEALPMVVRGSSVSWVEEFYKALNAENSTSLPQSSRELIALLNTQFFPSHPQFVNDVVFNSARTSILASRFYVTCKKLNGSDDEAELMVTSRGLATNASLSMKAFSPDFVFYEHYVSIMKNTLLPVGVTMIGMLFVALVFIPHPIAVTCVTLSMSSVVLGVMGLMHFWSLALSAIATIQIILGVGICVSFTVHTSHAFMTATGKNRNERVAAALEKVGVYILNGALASILSTAVLSLGTSFIFVSFFKTMLLVFILGVLHSVVFLPVMLSFIGPRRTSKPRMFIPVSPSVRSLQDANNTSPAGPTSGATSPDEEATSTDITINGERLQDGGSTIHRSSISSMKEDQSGKQNHKTAPTEQAEPNDDEPKNKRVSFRRDRDNVQAASGTTGDGLVDGQSKLITASPPVSPEKGKALDKRYKNQDFDQNDQRMSNGKLIHTIEELTEESEV